MARKKSGPMSPPPGSVLGSEGRPSTDQGGSVQVSESETVTVTSAMVAIEAPILVLAGYEARRLDTVCTGTQAKGWKALAMGLEQQEVRLENGKFVRTATDAVRWIGEQIAGQLGE